MGLKIGMTMSHFVEIGANSAPAMWLRMLTASVANRSSTDRWGGIQDATLYRKPLAAAVANWINGVDPMKIRGVSRLQFYTFNPISQGVANGG